MSCDAIQHNLTLYVYDELPLAEREEVERHTAACEACAAALEDTRNLLWTMDQRESLDPSTRLLAECRAELLETVQAVIPARAGGLMNRLMVWFRPLRPAWQPAAAMALLAVGFWAGKAVDIPANTGSLMTSGVSADGPIADVAEIQSVSLDPERGEVRIVVEEVARRTISGSPQDPQIRNLLLAAAREYPSSGVRLDTVDVLTDRVDDSRVRSVLLESMIQDENPGVRLKALDALRPHRTDPAVRQALVEVLRGDDNPGMRVQAIDMLTESPDREMVGLLQDLVAHERNNYVRLQCRRALHEMNASVERF